MIFLEDSRLYGWCSNNPRKSVVSEPPALHRTNEKGQNLNRRSIFLDTSREYTNIERNCQISDTSHCPPVPFPLKACHFRGMSILPLGSSPVPFPPLGPRLHVGTNTTNEEHHEKKDRNGRTIHTWLFHELDLNNICPAKTDQDFNLTISIYERIQTINFKKNMSVILGWILMLNVFAFEPRLAPQADRPISTNSSRCQPLS